MNLIIVSDESHLFQLYLSNTHTHARTYTYSCAAEEYWNDWRFTLNLYFATGSETHFRVVVVSDVFEGLSLIKVCTARSVSEVEG